MAPSKRINVTRKPSGQDYKKHRPNHGRQQLRQVTRTARRDSPQEEDSILNESEVDSENENSHIEPQGVQKFSEGKAYDALLTLLKADQKIPLKNGSKTGSKNISKSSQQEVMKDDISEEDEDEDDIAGANIEDESESEDDAEIDDFSDVEEGDLGQNTANGCEKSIQKHLTQRNSKDPFEVHFNLISEEEVAKKSKESQESKWEFPQKRIFVDSPYVASVQVPPNDCGVECSIPQSESLSGFTTIKSRVKSEYLTHFPDPLNSVDASLLREMLEYKDISYAYQNYKNDSYQKLYLTHVLNHTFKTRDRILKNNEKIRAYNEALKDGTSKQGVEEPELRDQGFTRPKVLILLPTRNAAYEVVEQLIKLSGSEQQENRKKFKSQFYSDGTISEMKPADFRNMFKGNSNDFFSLGLKFTRKTVKLYSSFFSSDILIASPIGLSMILEDPKQSKREYDFLSSIEIMILDQANQIEMQNWDHVGTVLKYVNKIPKNFHGADFSRIRMYAINDQARFLRQTLVFSEFLTPSINSIISRSCNLAGKARYKPQITSKTCIMNSVGLKIKQIFQRFDAPDPQTNHESRYKFFINAVLPSITKQNSYEDGLLIYIPSYFDYVRIKAYMKAHTKHNFASIDEYSSRSKVSRARHNFAVGKVKLLLYTERLHHFRRYEIAGVKDVLIYETPANPLFYKEILRFVGKSVFNEHADVDLSFVKTLYSKWDVTALERVVGNERAPILCNAVNEIYEFR